jgi:hypothetical protein
LSNITLLRIYVHEDRRLHTHRKTMKHMIIYRNVSADVSDECLTDIDQSAAELEYLHLIHVTSYENQQLSMGNNSVNNNVANEDRSYDKDLAYGSPVSISDHKEALRRMREVKIPQTRHC